MLMPWLAGGAVTGPGGTEPPEGDPFYDHVVFQSRWDGTHLGHDAVEESQYSWTMTYNIGTSCRLSNAQVFSGPTSLECGVPSVTGVLTVPANAVFNFSNQPFTIETYFYAKSVFNGAHIMGKYQTTSNQRSIAVQSTSTGGLRLLLSANGSAFTEAFNVSGPMVSGQWYHVCVDFDGSTYRGYVDGEIIGTYSTPITLFDASSIGLSFGAFYNRTNGIQGYFDNTRVTIGAARYAGAFTPPGDFPLPPP